ncbi:MAG: hypothetical protein WBW69_13540 [Candidatus Korobacteraceae bacterium]
MQDSHIPLGRAFQKLYGRLIGGTFVCGDRFSTLSNSMMTDRWFKPASNVFTGVPRVRKRPPPASIAGRANLAYSASAAGFDTERKKLTQYPLAIADSFNVPQIVGTSIELYYMQEKKKPAACTTGHRG